MRTGGAHRLRRTCVHTSCHRSSGGSSRAGCVLATAGTSRAASARVPDGRLRAEVLATHERPFRATHGEGARVRSACSDGDLRAVALLHSPIPLGTPESVSNLSSYRFYLNGIRGHASAPPLLHARPHVCHTRAQVPPLPTWRNVVLPSPHPAHARVDLRAPGVHPVALHADVQRSATASGGPRRAPGARLRAGAQDEGRGRGAVDPAAV